MKVREKMKLSGSLGPNVLNVNRVYQSYLSGLKRAYNMPHMIYHVVQNIDTI